MKYVISGTLSPIITFSLKEGDILIGEWGALAPDLDPNKIRVTLVNADGNALPNEHLSTLEKIARGFERENSSSIALAMGENPQRVKITAKEDCCISLSCRTYGAITPLDISGSNDIDYWRVAPGSPFAFETGIKLVKEDFPTQFGPELKLATGFQGYWKVVGKGHFFIQCRGDVMEDEDGEFLHWVEPGKKIVLAGSTLVGFRGMKFVGYKNITNNPSIKAALSSPVAAELQAGPNGGYYIVSTMTQGKDRIEDLSKKIEELERKLHKQEETIKEQKKKISALEEKK